MDIIRQTNAVYCYKRQCYRGLIALQQKVLETADYTIEREFLGDITVTELVEQIIRSHLFTPSNQETSLLQEERKGRELL